MKRRKPLARGGSRRRVSRGEPTAPRRDVWAHPDGSPHSTLGPDGCEPCMELRRAMHYEQLAKEAGGRVLAVRGSKYARRPRAVDFMGFVARQRCTVSMIGLAGIRDAMPVLALPCSGPIQVDHIGERIAGKGTRSRDRDTAAMCLEHHGQRTRYEGVFEGLTEDEHRAWCAAAIAYTHELARGQGVEIPSC